MHGSEENCEIVKCLFVFFVAFVFSFCCCCIVSVAWTLLIFAKYTEQIPLVFSLSLSLARPLSILAYDHDGVSCA